MTAPEVGAHRTQLDAAVRALALQVDRDTVLKARAALLAEADRLDSELRDEAQATSLASACAAVTLCHRKLRGHSTSESTPRYRVLRIQQ